MTESNEEKDILDEYFDKLETRLKNLEDKLIEKKENTESKESTDNTESIENTKAVESKKLELKIKKIEEKLKKRLL